ncbi:phospholipid-transporting ATPase ABCA3-like [Diorhabda carinulata]|uniref:phospholipid-transporting ATPase ABCA3-like n=1 Tax=Diorhabda carinulata TaxID=1163345 RepID=UPI0025A08234|nr:phospholipid-transporting ATPase ABCA3-like [Diorhabda carinulata]
MGEKVDKFLLLMWKNWILQYRKPIQTAIEILTPVIFSILLVLIRSLSTPKLEHERIYDPFCTFSTALSDFSIDGCANPDGNDATYAGLLDSIGSEPGPNLTIIYTPVNSSFDQAMNYLNFTSLIEVIGVETSQELEEAALSQTSSYFGIEFEGDLDDPKVAIRFPGETTFQLDSIGFKNWKTNLVYPIFQSAGPRSPDNNTGSVPNYNAEGFSFIQHLVTITLILAKENVSSDNAIEYLSENLLPIIYMRRFPVASWYSDLLIQALSTLLGMIVMLSFVYTCINTVKMITAEKEKQLKESMKIMGLPNWLHWLAWFIKCFVFLLISVVLMVILLKVRWYQNTEFTVFTHADASVLLVFLLLYACSTITFCFAISVFFSKANTAATLSGLIWFLTFAPYAFMQNNYSETKFWNKLLPCLLTNTGMGFGFQIVIMYEGTGDGIQWSNLFKPNTPDDDMSLGLVWIMLALSSLLHMLIALYVEAVFPGEYGVPQKWYYFVTKKYWFGDDEILDNSSMSKENFSEFIEEEPKNLNVGIKIFNLRKTFGKKTAVRDLSLNIYENQITVLLGHNGAGKTTTMSMLTGMITPSEGTAIINGCDIRTNIAGARASLGLCPQHNIIFDELTVAEHFYFFSKLKGLSKSEINQEIDKYVKLLDLESKRDAKSATLSGGMKRKLCVGVALCGNSKVVMLDEPTAGMDPSARRVLWELLQKQKDDRTILLSTHFMDEADLLGDRIAIMAGGELQCCGSSFFLKKKYGAGYSLIMDKTRECNPHQVTELLKKFIPDIEIQSNVGSELTYLLTESNAPVFEAMLTQLELESKKLGVRSYGISLTTMEEVFMKVGADHGQEEMYDEKENGMNQKKALSSEGTILVDSVSLQPVYTGGFDLAVNQFLAMLLKKVIGTYRSWILITIMILFPVINMIIVMTIPNSSSTTIQPEMPLDLTRFTDPVTLVEFDENESSYSYVDCYNDVLKQYGLSTTKKNITDEMLYLTRTNPNLVRRRYLVGASFEEQSIPSINEHYPKITAWFNHDPYHTPGITLSFVLSALYKHHTNVTGYLKFSNKPLPYKAETQLSMIVTGQSQGFQVAFNIGFSMAFVASYFVIFAIRENVSKSKHLQFVSGIKTHIFWFVHYLCDMITYIIIIGALLITIVCFQQDGFKTVADMSRLFLILLLFGFSVIPLYYLASLVFVVPSTGYTRMTMIGIFIGNAAFLVVQVLNSPGLDLEYIGKALDWVFLVSPIYSMTSAIFDSYLKYSYLNICDKYYFPILQQCIEKNPVEECLEKLGADIVKICSDINDNYFEWQSPGIGRNIVFTLFTCFFWILLLLIVEYKVFSRLIYYVNQKLFPRHPIDIQDEDDDVAREKLRIHNLTDSQIVNNHSLVLKDLTKYYKKFLAVNGLTLGIEGSECFGLLGVNGAGKTTTFKMMSGDENISYGEAWIGGKSVKTELEEVHRKIGYCPQFDALLDDMTAKETIIMYCLLRGIELKRAKMTAVYLSREFDFFRHLDKKVKEMSGGNKRKLSTVLSLIGDPPVIFLDEPSAGMDPATKRYLWNSLCKIRDRGKCIVLTSHSMEECEALCTRIAIMVNGNFKCLGSIQHLKNKFAEGYTLTIKVKKPHESSGLHHTETEPIERFIKDHFPGAQLREKHQELLTYYITDKSMAWSKMFGILERGKRGNLNLEDYSLGQSSLEQVFLTFTKHQKPEGE